MSNPQKSKKHHYVPEFLIKGFSSQADNSVFIYDKPFNNLNPVPKAASRICHDLHLYSLSVGEQKSQVLEEMFSGFESKWKEMLFMLHEKDSDILYDDPNAKKIIRNFIACQFWRNPSRHQLAMDSIGRVMNYYDQAREKGELIFPMERKDLKKIIKNKFNKNSQKIIQHFILPALTFSIASDSTVEYRIVKKPDEFRHDFICSDNPIIYKSIEDVFSIDEARFFPIRRDCILVSSPGNFNIGINDLEDFQVKLFDNATKWVFSSTLQSLEKYINLTN